MATLATYPIYYFIGGSSTTPDSYLPTYVYGPDTGPTTLEDDHDGTDDGLITVGDQLSWSRDTLGSGFKITTLYGFAANGDPIIEVYNASFGSYNYYQLSSDPDLQGDTLSITRSGTYQMCFMAGAKIAVPGGERLVEDLSIGDRAVIPPFLAGSKSRIYAAFSFWLGVIPPMPMFGLSLLYVQSQRVA